MFDKKAYDAQQQRKRYADYQVRRQRVYENLGNVCYLCSAEKRESFHLHHVVYHPLESNYPKHSNAMSVRLKRLKEAETNPERFVLLCPVCHGIVHILENNKGIDLGKLIELSKA